MLIKFRCECGKKLIVNEEFVGAESQCTRCGGDVRVPSPQEVGNKICPGCGALVSPDASACPHCSGLRATARLDSEKPSPKGVLKRLVKDVPWFAISAAVHIILITLLFSCLISIEPEKRARIALKAELIEIEEQHSPDNREYEDPFVDQPGDVGESGDEDELAEQVAVMLDEIPLSGVVDMKEVVIAEPVRPAESADLDDFGVNLRNALSELQVDSPYGPKPYSSRYGTARKKALKRGGGGRNTERAVLEALKWLARHQSPDGRWGAAGFQDQCGERPCTGLGFSSYDVGVTGLAILAFLGAGNTNIYGEFQENVARALEYLSCVQKQNGLFGDGNMYNHAIATFAVCEAFSLNKHLIRSEDPRIRSKLKVKHPLDDVAFMKQMSRLKMMARRGIDYLEDARNPDMAWRYVYRPGNNDTSVTGWAALAISSAISANLAVKERTIAGMKRWISRVTDPETHRVGYVIPGAGSDAMSAVGMTCRLYFGVSRKHPHIIGGQRILLNHLPRRNDDQGWRVYYWYYGSLAMFQIGGKAWRRWNAALKDCLIPAQRKKGCERGSWPPVDADGLAGGRVYSTAMCALSLEVYYRYPRRE